MDLFFENVLLFNYTNWPTLLDNLSFQLLFSELFGFHEWKCSDYVFQIDCICRIKNNRCGFYQLHIRTYRSQTKPCYSVCNINEKRLQQKQKHHQQTNKHEINDANK